MEYKSSAATLDYTQNWSNWLASGDTIATSSWSSETGITIDSHTNDTTTATVVVSGGTNGKTYKLTNTITTSNGLDESMSWFVKIQDQLA